MSYQCNGCGETRPLEPSVEIQSGTVYLDGERVPINGKRFCPDCAPGPTLQ